MSGRGVPGAARASPQLTLGGVDCQPCPRELVWDGVPVQIDVLRRGPNSDVVKVHDVLGRWGHEGEGGGGLSRRRRRAVPVESAVWRVTANNHVAKKKLRCIPRLANRDSQT